MKSLVSILLLLSLLPLGRSQLAPSGGAPGASASPINSTFYSGILVLAAKNVTITTSAGGATDIATLTIPSYVTRYNQMCAQASGTGNIYCFFVYAENLAGTAGAATFDVRTAANGGGASLLTTTPAGPTATGAMTATRSPTVLTTVQTATTLYIRQSADSANAGTLSFYLYIMPLP